MEGRARGKKVSIERGKEGMREVYDGKIFKK